MAFSNVYTPSTGVQAPKTGVGSGIGNREDLSNELTLLAPEETPILSLASKGKANAVYSEWVTDKLDAPLTAGVAEGADVTSFTDQFSGRARLGNYVQIFRRDYQVSQIQQAVTSVGPANIAQAEAKSMRELKRDVEYAICADQEYAQSAGTSSTPQLRGLGKWLTPAGTTLANVDAAFQTPANSVYSVSGTAPTETNINDIVASIFTVNGEANSLTCVAGVSLRKAIANFTRTQVSGTGTYKVNQDATGKEVTLAVQVFDSDFGIVNIVNANPVCLTSTNTTAKGYVLNPKYLGFNTLYSMGATRLENRGGGERGYVDMSGTLCVKHPGAHGKIVY